MPLTTQQVLAKKRDGLELTQEELEVFVRGIQHGEVSATQAGAMLMACHLRGVSDPEVAHLMKAMMTSGHSIKWPDSWLGKIGSLQSTGSTGNKAKLILAPAMAACGLKFPIMSARGYDVVGGILSKLKCIEGFEGNQTTEQIGRLLDTVGCCVISQPPDVAPAETLIRDMAADTTTGNNQAFKEACMIARVAALRLRAVVIEIAYGPGEWIKERDEALQMAKKLDELSSLLGIRARVVLTRVEWPVGRMIGSSLEVAEAVRCMNGEGPDDLHELVCKLGGHILHATGISPDAHTGQGLVHKRIKDGSTKKKFAEMLKAQGVPKDDVRSLIKHRKDEFNISPVLPVPQYYTHLSSDGEGYIHGIDLTILNKVVYELTKKDTALKLRPASGVHLTVTIGSFLKKGDVWAKLHHDTRLDENHMAELRLAVRLKDAAPDIKHLIHIEEYARDGLKRVSTAAVLNNKLCAVEFEDDVFEESPLPPPPPPPADSNGTNGDVINGDVINGGGKINGNDVTGNGSNATTNGDGGGDEAGDTDSTEGAIFFT